MRVAIVKYNAGNVLSVVNALRRLGIEPQITDSAQELASADKVIFPGQGEASSTMAYLREHGLDRVIKSLRQPVLGICIGQQLLCKNSEEGGGTECLGVFDADVRLFRPARHEDKVPAMGWNALTGLKSRLFDGMAESDYVYFVHSYYVPVCAETIATSEHTLPYSAALGKDNFYATQFHPEKSGSVGERILKNFLSL